MAFLYSGAGGNAETVAAQIDSQVGSAMAQVAAWRTRVNATGSVSSLEAENVYQALASVRTYIQARKTVAGLADAFERRFPTHPGYDPAAEWNAAKAAIEAFASWFQVNWPARTAANFPAFSQFSASTGELVSFSVDLAASPRATLIALLDAVAAAFETA